MAIEQACRARGEAIGVWFEDVASARTLERPQLLRLRAAVARGTVNRLWVWRLDRLSRSGIVETIGCIREFRDHGCSVASVCDPFALDGPAAEIILAVLAWVAAEERRAIHERLAAARSRMTSEGRAWGRPATLPSGFAELARRKQAEGKSIRQIARELQISKSTAWKFLQPEPVSEIGN